MYIYNDNTANKMNSIIRQIKEIADFSEHIDIKGTTDSIKKGIEFKGPNAWILFFAVIIAAAGLNINSIPVIIGAMLISPLMGPIMGVGLSMGTNDTELLSRSLRNLAVMVIISITASTIFFLISPLNLDEPTELLARTKPTIYDVIIALFGGLAGIIESSRKEKGTVVAGVAIATALMPPLCTAGFGIATGNLGFFIGALYLFFINSIFISISVYLIIRYMEFPIVKVTEELRHKKLRKNIAIIVIIFILPSFYTAFVVIKENNFSQSAKQFVKENKITGKSFIYDYNIDHSKYPSLLSISFAGDPLNLEEKKLLYKKLEEKGIMRSQLNINELLSFNADSENDVVKNMFNLKQNEVQKKDSIISTLEKTISDLQNRELPANKIYNEILAQHPGIVSFSATKGSELNIKSGKPEEKIIVLIKWKKSLSEVEIKTLSDWLSVRLEIKNIKVIQED